ncbi:GDSL-type esterase/lipase family protein [Catellatospora sp. KI3]|uniref:GDSL-type esterase/lipase family protein n=1 Tax=Catellatospora sp. KI3 TaxID=3041620 RepID=UPI0024830CA6|nr:GDSL-type esterase/lipase family protein [Catellatospora sp. KI3]MDI1463173.1 GDSL-type esterase/lipase family protein [Catellatospora sp. KI3]
MITVFRRRALIGVATLGLLASTVVGAAGPASGGLPARWVGTWGTALTAASLGNTGSSLAGFNDQSIRQVVRISLGGEKVRLRFTNAYGNQPLSIGHVTVALPATPGSAQLKPGSVREVTFGGSASTTVYKGADVLSDPVDLSVEPVSELAVTIYLPTATGPASWHWTARQASYIYAGDHATDETGAAPTATYNNFFYLAGVEVSTKTGLGTVVVLGDSVSDGSGATFGANTRWPDQLANRINSTFPALGDPGVINVSLAGSEVTRDGIGLNSPALGESALARLDYDVLAQPGVRSVILELGVNDISFFNDPAARITEGLRQLAVQAKARGIRVVVATIGPFEGYSSWTADKEATRQAVNTWLRGSDAFDNLLDLDQIVRDPAAPSKLLPAYDSGDHIHPNDAGAAAIAAAIPLWQL